MSLEVVKRLLQQETSATGVHCRQPGATGNLPPTHAGRQEARPMLDWPFSCVGLCSDGSISFRAT